MGTIMDCLVLPEFIMNPSPACDGRGWSLWQLGSDEVMRVGPSGRGLMPYGDPKRACFRSPDSPCQDRRQHPHTTRKEALAKPIMAPGLRLLHSLIFMSHHYVDPLQQND